MLRHQQKLDGACMSSSGSFTERFLERSHARAGPCKSSGHGNIPKEMSKTSINYLYSRTTIGQLSHNWCKCAALGCRAVVGTLGEALALSSSATTLSLPCLTTGDCKTYD